MSSSVLYRAVKETLVEYFQKTSLNGFGLLYYIRRRKYQRLFWFMFIVMGITFATFVCMATIVSFLSEPTVTTLDAQQHTIWSVPFPSIAVCSNNKFSHNAIRQYAREIAQNSFDYYPAQYWEPKLELFAGFLNTDSIDFDEASKFNNELEYINGKAINTRETIKTLAPKCQDLLVQCYWAGELQKCEEQFKLMAFIDGACCVFNYQIERTPETLYYPESTGPEMGLTLLLNASTSDYFYAEDNSNGFTIQIFDTQRVPDISTGEMKEFHVSAGEDVDVKLNLVSHITTEEARVHMPRKRGCYFPHEHKDGGNGQSECLLKCKMRSIEALCECVPFYAFDSGLKDKINEISEQCTLAHSECLERYRVTWQTYFPFNSYLNPNLKDELVDSISCPDCLPLCSYNHHHYRKIVGNLSETRNQHVNRKYLSSFPELSSDLSLVKIYFPSEFGVKYQKGVLFNWYQILSSIGGVIGICMGCSIISGFEIIYFGSFRLLQKYLEFRRNAK